MIVFFASLVSLSRSAIPFVLLLLCCLPVVSVLADDTDLALDQELSYDSLESVVELNSVSAKSVIESIKASEDFGGKKTENGWRFKKDDSVEKDSPIPQWLIDVAKFFESIGQALAFIPAALEVILWILAAVLVAALIYVFRNTIRDFVRPQREQEYADLPVSMFGLDIRKESMPDDIIAEVRILLAQERYREALGLLYRATISRLIHQYQFEFHAGNTEGECASIVRKRNDISLFRYFDRLTRCWKQLAYGHTIPAAEELDSLCVDWQLQFKTAAPEQQVADTDDQL